MVIASSTIISDTVLFLRDLISTKVTDPHTSTRDSNSKFVLTSYPSRPVSVYPIITVKLVGMSQNKRLGMRAEADFLDLNIEVRVWTKNEIQKDSLTQQVYTALRQNQTDASTGSIANELFGFTLTSINDVDETGVVGVKSKVMEYTYNGFGLG